MEFKQKQTIYLQIAESICEKIVGGLLSEGEKISSIRSLAVDLEVNPNTVQRTYEHLQSEGVIYTQRGLGYFVSEGAKAKIKHTRKAKFLEKELPSLFKNMSLLDIDIDLIVKKHKEFKK
ncbi:MAG: GntR family transcriptional regulator [Crocinitomix sp.]|nr:GntR family transcriptional regulator [Crocinitomix sp.]